MRSLRPAHDEDLAFAKANATLTRILGAIEEYVYTGEFLADGAYQVVFAGPCRERFLGLSVKEARSAVWVHYVHPDDTTVFQSAHDGALASSHLDVEYRMVGADGIVRWVRDRGRIRNEHDRRFLDGSILDVTAIHHTQQALEAARAEAERLAHVDPLTGLANRRSLPDRLTRLTSTDELGVLAVDVDHFKQINDCFGHASGDRVLTEIAARLRTATRTGDEIVRMGGEEFLVLLPGVGDETALLDIAAAICSEIRTQPVTAGSERIDVTVSIGAALTELPDADADKLLNLADGALYAAKRAGRNRVHLAGSDPADLEAVDEQSATLRLARTLAALTGAATARQEADANAVSLLAARIARRLGATAPQVLRCRLAGLVLDIGYLRLPVDLLATPDPLTTDAWTLVRAHPVYGEQLIQAVPELRYLSRIIRHHHEQWDGHGYPDRLRGNAIPLEARILAAADRWHALTSAHPHRPAPSDAAAHAELDRSSAAQLDPEVTSALRSVLLQRRDHDPSSATDRDPATGP